MKRIKKQIQNDDSGDDDGIYIRNDAVDNDNNDSDNDDDEVIDYRPFVFVYRQTK